MTPARPHTRRLATTIQPALERYDRSPNARPGAPFAIFRASALRSEPLSDPTSTTPPDDTTAPTGSSGERARSLGLRAQLLAVRDAATGLGRAHLDLAKAEMAGIAGEVGRVAALAALALISFMLAGLLATVGGSLFLGEWLFGSLGWGVLHGILTFAAIAVAVGLLAAGVAGDRIGRSLLGSVLAAIAAGLVFGLDLSNRMLAAVGESMRLNISPDVRPLVVGLLIGGLVGVLVGFAAATRAGTASARTAAIVGLLVVGALVGGFSSITLGPQAGAGAGVAVGWLTWIRLMGADAARHGITVDRFKERFYPSQTIETGKETIEWLQKRMPPGFGS